MASLMSAVEELEKTLTLGQAQQLADFSTSSPAEGAACTQQLLDELLGRFEEDDSPMCLAHRSTPELYADPDE